jgi:hypothetical protein
MVQRSWLNEVGHPLRWISEGDRFAFWKAEVKHRLVSPEADGLSLGDYPGHCCYVAAAWKFTPAATVIVL